MKSLFKRFKWLLIVSGTLFVAVILLAVIPTNYDLCVPATIADIDNIYDFTYEDDEGNKTAIDTSNININSVAVFSYYRISLLSYLQALCNPFAVLTKTNEYVNTSLKYNYTSGTIQKNASLTNALIIGYKLANKPINYEFKGSIIHSIFGLDDSKLKLGDIIIECEGRKVTEDNNVSRILQDVCGVRVGDDGLYYLDIKLNTDYHFKVLRNNEALDVTIQAFDYTYDQKNVVTLGFNYYSHYEIYQEGTNPSFKIDVPSTFGPSAGLMQALFIYEALSGEKLTKCLKVVGTGTVDEYGYAGAIGGVQAKIVAAHLASCDYFFVPSANYEEAYTKYKTLKTDMKLVSVDYLQDVVKYLRKVQEGGN